MPSPNATFEERTMEGVKDKAASIDKGVMKALKDRGVGMRDDLSDEEFVKWVDMMVAEAQKQEATLGITGWTGPDGMPIAEPAWWFLLGLRDEDGKALVDGGPEIQQRYKQAHVRMAKKVLDQWEKRVEGPMVNSLDLSGMQMQGPGTANAAEVFYG